MDKNQGTLAIVFIIGILLISILLVLNPSPTKIIPLENQNAITVSGNSDIKSDPDLLEVFIKIESSSDNAQEAKDRNAKTSENVRATLKRIGISEKDIETSSFSLNPRYRYDKDSGESILSGYTLSNQLKVSSKNIDMAGKIIDTSVDAGANGVDRVTFTLSEDKKSQVFSQALDKASREARQKAMSIASSLDVRLGNLVSVEESNFNYVAFDYSARNILMESKSATEISPEKVSVSARISVSYEIA
jgi:uncharacterized protein